VRGDGAKRIKREASVALVQSSQDFPKKPRKDFRNEICEYVNSAGKRCGKTGHTAWFHNKHYPEREFGVKQVSFKKEIEEEIKDSGQSNHVTAVGNEDDIAAGNENDIKTENQGYSFVTSMKNGINEEWGVDSCCSHHMTGNMDMLSDTKTVKDLKISVANDHQHNSNIIGVARIHLESGDKLILNNVYYVPGLARNLISVGKLAAGGNSLEFGEFEGIMKDKENNLVFKCSKKNGIYIVNMIQHTPDMGEANYTKQSTDTIIGWHERLGHLNFADIQKMHDQKLVEGLYITTKRKATDNACESCLLGKIKRVKTNLTSTRSKDQQDQVTSVDIVGPINPISRHGNKYIFFSQFYRFYNGQIWQIEVSSNGCDNWLVEATRQRRT
jgi:hypothetical protein